MGNTASMSSIKKYIALYNTNDLHSTEQKFAVPKSIKDDSVA